MAMDQDDVGQSALRLDRAVVEASGGIGFKPSAIRSAPVNTARTSLSAFARRCRCP